MDLTNPKKTPRRTLVRLWVASFAALTILALGISDTLSSWTAAIITNSTNTTSSADAVALRETGPGGITCDTGSTSDNTATCTSINKYEGGTLAPLESSYTEVTLTNTGTASGALTLNPGPCSTSGGTSGSTKSLCDHANVRLTCTGRSMIFYSPRATAPISLGTLAPNESVTCEFSIQVNASAPAEVSGQLLSQELVWKLTRA